MLDVKKTLAKILNNTFRIEELKQGITVAELIELPTGIYSNGNRTTNLPTQYGLLLVVDGGYHKAYAYFSTELGISYAVNTHASTSFSWINLSGYMRANMASNQTLPQGTTVLNLNSAEFLGSGLTFNGSTHEITVGTGVHKIEVSACAYVFTLGTAGSKGIAVQKNGSNVVRSIRNLTNNYNMVTIPSYSFGVTNGDKIRLVGISNNGSTTVFNGGGETWLNVRVIA